MEAIGWLLAYAAGFALLQLVLYRYFDREGPSPDAAPAGAESAPGRSLERPSPADDPADAAAGVACRHCGAVNERAPTYAYCRACVGRLR